MVSRPTISDVARTAGVSVSTVDRVLNGRARVREDTARRVFEAAQSIGYHAAPLIHQRMTEALPLIRLGFMLQSDQQPFYVAFRDAALRVVEATRGVRVKVEVFFAPSQSPWDCVAGIEALKGKVDVLGVASVDHPAVTDAISRAEDDGIPCFAFLNDCASGVRRGYIGMNNMRVGRTAAHMIATAARQPGKVAIFIGGFRWHGHELRETGFRSYFREFAPEFHVLETLINLETGPLTYDATRKLLKQHADVRGIYCAGGGMEGVIAAVREARAPREVALVINELTADSRRALAERYIELVIATPLDRVCADFLNSALRVTADANSQIPGQHFVMPDLYLPESV